MVEFSSYNDMKSALEKMNGSILDNQRIRLIEEKSSESLGRRSRSHSSSRSRSRRRSRSRSKSASRSSPVRNRYISFMTLISLLSYFVFFVLINENFLFCTSLDRSVDRDPSKSPPQSAPWSQTSSPNPTGGEDHFYFYDYEVMGKGNRSSPEHDRDD